MADVQPDPRETEVHRAARARFAAIKDQLVPKMAARAANEPAFANPEVMNLQVAQNVLRECLEAVLKEMIPFSALTAGELAIRLASYAISVAPLDEQAEVMRWVLPTLPVAHASRLNRGIMIQSSWYMPAGPSEPVKPHGRADA
jgi:hypothetical protein